MSEIRPGTFHGLMMKPCRNLCSVSGRGFPSCLNLCVFVRNHSYENVYMTGFVLGLVLKQGPNGNDLMIVILGFMHQFGSNLGKTQRTMSAELLKIN